MKKAFIALFVIAALTVSTSSFAFGLDLKKKACEKGCEKTYDNCVEKAKKESESAVKQKAGEAACKKAKDECVKKCG